MSSVSPQLQMAPNSPALPEPGLALHGGSAENPALHLLGPWASCLSGREFSPGWRLQSPSLCRGGVRTGMGPVLRPREVCQGLWGRSPEHRASCRHSPPSYLGGSLLMWPLTAPSPSAVERPPNGKRGWSRTPRTGAWPSSRLKPTLLWNSISPCRCSEPGRRPSPASAGAQAG